MHTGKLEQYKRLIRFGFNILLLAILIFFFIHIWDENYNDGIVFPFYYKGYLMMAAFYAFFFTVFSYILGGMKIGYLKSSSLMLSQTLALLASNVLIYLETVLLSAKFIPVEAMIVLTFIDVGSYSSYNSRISLGGNSFLKIQFTTNVHTKITPTSINVRTIIASTGMNFAENFGHYYSQLRKYPMFSLQTFVQK